MLSQDGELCVLTRTLQTLLLHFLVRGGGERLDTVRSSRPSYSITTRRTCPASGRTGRGRQMRQQLQQRSIESPGQWQQSKTPQTSLSRPVLLLVGCTPEAYYEMLPLSKQRQAAPLQSHLSIQWRGGLGVLWPLIRRRPTKAAAALQLQLLLLL